MNKYKIAILLASITMMAGCTPESLDDNFFASNNITRSCINLIDTRDVETDAVISNNGSVLKNSSRQSIVTNYICVHLGDAWYQKTIYLHACCSRKSIYGFQADVIAFYDDKKRYIMQEHNVSAPIVIPQDARYARIQYRNTDEQLFAAITNRSIISEYTAYDRTHFTEIPEKNYVKVNNSDASISHVLRTGYDYLDRDLGYGSLHTAYNSYCIKAESYDNSYSGQKRQIDCSSFVELALTGVNYSNSRYARGSEAENIAVEDSFCFDSCAEYNYNMIQFPEECGADFGRMYANKIAKYFYDRGYFYEIENNLSNVQIGDLLFIGNGSPKSEFFLNIVHVGICSDIWQKKNGKRVIHILETASETEIDYEALSNRRFCFGARPELPFKENADEHIELIKSLSDSTAVLSLKAGETKLLSTILLREDLLLREVYTLYLKCNIPSGAAIICQNSVETPALGSNDVNELYVDGQVIKHFGVRDRLLGKNKNKIEIYIYALDAISDKVSIKEVSLKKGMHRYL